MNKVYSSFFPIVENGEKLKTENNIHNGTYDDGNFNVQSKRQVREVNLFRNDRSSTFSKMAFRINKAVINIGT